MENHHLHPITLSAGEVLGEIEEVEIVSPGEWHVSDEEIYNIQSIGEFYETYTDYYSSAQAMKLFSVLK